MAINNSSKNINGSTISLLSISSTSLAVGMISILCVVSVPLFPNARSTNDWGRIFRIIADSISISFLVYVSGVWHSIVLGLHNLINYLQGKPRSNYVNIERTTDHLNILGVVFFIGALLALLWNVTNEIYLSGDCFRWISLVDHALVLIFGVLLLVVMCQKVSTCHTTIAYLGWSIVAATCFSKAFRYIVEEVIQAYIDIVEKSIKDPDYGLDIPSNITSPEEYVPKIFKLRAKCLHHAFWPWFKDNILENCPFSAEYFLLATCFCVFTWRNLSLEKCSANNADNSNEALISVPSSSHSVNNAENQVNSNNFPNISINAAPADDNFKCFKFNKWTALVISAILILATILSWLYFLHEMTKDVKYRGFLTFKLQLMVFQLALVILEFIFFWKMSKLKGLEVPPEHFGLDILLLIFPLLPLGVLLCLRGFPDLISLSTDISTHINTIFHFGLIGLNFFQVAFQAVFISQLVYRLNHNDIKSCRYFFLVLAVINVCIWFTWSSESKSITINGQSSKLFGMVPWIIVVYSTLPFTLFCYAHTAACLLDIFKHLGNHQEAQGTERNGTSSSLECENKIFVDTNDDGNGNDDDEIISV